MYNNEIIQGLNSVCEEFKEGKFIMSAFKIPKILRYLAANDELMEIIRESNRAADYRSELSAAVNRLSGVNAFRMPKDPRKVIALVTGILYGIDRKEMDLLTFLKDYFEEGDLDVDFNLFYDTVITPYVYAFAQLLDNQPIEIESHEDVAADIPNIELICEQVVPFIEELYNLVVGDNMISEVKREEYITMLEGMCYALEESHSHLLKFIWIGFKNTFSGYVMASASLQGISDVLSAYSVLG